MSANLPREQRIELMRRAWALAVEGRSQLTIATELGISQSQVSRYLASARRRAWDELAEEARTYLILSLRQADKILDEAFKAFERSTRPKKSATKKTTPISIDGLTKGGATDQTTTQVTEREGDPAWLGTAMSAIQLRQSLLEKCAPRSDELEDTGDGTLAGAILEAERRNEAYACDDSTSSSIPEAPTATTSSPAMSDRSDLPPPANSELSSSS